MLLDSLLRDPENIVLFMSRYPEIKLEPIGQMALRNAGDLARNARIMHSTTLL